LIMTGRRHDVSDDWFVAAVEGVAEAAGRACEAIQTAVRALECGREARLAGGSMAEIVDALIGGGGRVTRVSAAHAFREYERAVAAMRSKVVRELVDEGGLTLTEVSRRMRISRQAAGKLYAMSIEDTTNVPSDV
jgi:hypothetical protein